VRFKRNSKLSVTQQDYKLDEMVNTADFVYSRLVHYYETDTMGIVHHSNYLRYFEEARMAWLKFRGLNHLHAPHDDLTMAVLETRVQHHRPLYLDETLKVRLQIQLAGLKIRFAYAAYGERYSEAVATGESLHVPLDKNLRVTRLSKELKTQLETESWNETWPLNV
jgi:acyl-CoA thioester hydrolase